MLEHSSELSFVGRVCVDAACCPPAAASGGSVRAEELLLRYTHLCDNTRTHTHTHKDPFSSSCFHALLLHTKGEALLCGYFGICQFVIFFACLQGGQAKPSMGVF